MRFSLRLRALFLRAVATLALFVFGYSAPAAAYLCGDDVDGRDVPCHCGDIVVSDLVLSDDPVLSEPCPRDGLVVRVPHGSPGVTIDLAGNTLRGLGKGTGVRILSGGVGGARIVSTGHPALVEGFRDGIVSQASRFGLAELIDVRIRNSARDGLRVVGDGLLLRNIDSGGAQRDGIFVRGRGWTIEDIHARGNGRHGLSVMGAGYTIRPGSAARSVRAEGNGGDGIRLWGSDHRLRTCRAAGNVRNGISVNGIRLDLATCEAAANGAAGISGVATTTRFLDNQATDNLGGGIAIHGHSLLDGGGNVAVGNSGKARASNVECRLGLEACR